MSPPNGKSKESEFKNPALRISNIVYGRELRGTRVFYLVDPSVHTDEKAVPETVILKRWRMRRLEGYVFNGVRLSSTFWRAVDAAFPYKPSECCRFSEARLAELIDRNRTQLRTQHLSLPSTQALHAIFSLLGPVRVSKLVRRHAELQRAGRSGVPDLFLYATNVKTREPTMPRFVEVKKPDEPVSKDQFEEIAFLLKLGMPARVLRLIERKE